MEDSKQIAETLARLTKAIEENESALVRAVAREQAADATIEDAKARIDDAEAQVAHADSHMAAAKAHMAAAKSEMNDANVRAEQADDRKEEAVEQLGIAAEHMDEYQRALYHYQQLVRHRMANPLQAILGMAQTLLDDTSGEIPPNVRREMLEAIEAQALVLERISLFLPEQQSEEERELHAKPFEA